MIDRGRELYGIGVVKQVAVDFETGGGENWWTYGRRPEVTRQRKKDYMADVGL